jgi:hypothetical protein
MFKYSKLSAKNGYLVLAMRYFVELMFHTSYYFQAPYMETVINIL